MSASIKTKTIETIEYRVDVRNDHIEEGKCRDPHRCMEKLANYEALTDILGDGNVDRLRIDGAQIKFNFKGYRWSATTPKQAKLNLIKFDNRKTAHLVKPHSYAVTAIRGTKIVKVTAERQEQISRAREDRKKSGTPDKKRTSQTLHQRVVGLGAV